MNVLTPLFDVISEIAMTDIDLNVSIRKNHMYWYIGDINTMERDDNGNAIFTCGDMFDRVMLDDLDEDKITIWVAELQDVLDDYNTPLDENGIPIDDDYDRWQNNEEDSLDEIHTRENHYIDSQEDTQI